MPLITIYKFKDSQSFQYFKQYSMTISGILCISSSSRNADAQSIERSIHLVNLPVSLEIQAQKEYKLQAVASGVITASNNRGFCP